MNKTNVGLSLFVHSLSLEWLTLLLTPRHKNIPPYSVGCSNLVRFTTLDNARTRCSFTQEVQLVNARPLWLSVTFKAYSESSIPLAVIAADCSECYSKQIFVSS